MITSISRYFRVYATVLGIALIWIAANQILLEQTKSAADLLLVVGAVVIGGALSFGFCYIAPWVFARFFARLKQNIVAEIFFT